MRIGVNCFLLQPTIGGLKQYFHTLFHELLERDGENEYIFFWFDHNTDELEKVASDRWKRHAIKLADQRQIAAHLDQINLYFCPFGALYPRPLPLPTLTTLVDIQEVYFPEFFTEEDLYMRDLHYASSTHMSDRVMTISEFSKQSIVKFHHLPPEKVMVAYLSADNRFYRSAEIARKPDRLLPQNFIFCPANFWQHKNHDRLLQALRLLRDEHDLHVDLICTGYEQPNGYPLAAKAIEYGIAEQTHLLGYRSIEEIAWLYQHARMLVFPSLFEGFGIPLVEAMAVGCPIAAARSSSIPEVLDGAGQLFDPMSPPDIAATIARVWNDAALCQTMVQRGMQRAADFSAMLTAQAHRHAFTEARQAYSYQRYLWNQIIYQHYYHSRLALRWPSRTKQAVRRRLTSA